LFRWGLDVDICFFSWALGPRSSYFSVSLAAVIVCFYSTIVLCGESQEKDKSADISSLLIMTKQVFNSV